VSVESMYLLSLKICKKNKKQGVIVAKPSKRRTCSHNLQMFFSK
jgi:hypothetical protein